eukprot:1251769-Amphidinium_carterae.2
MKLKVRVQARLQRRHVGTSTELAAYYAAFRKAAKASATELIPPCACSNSSCVDWQVFVNEKRWLAMVTQARSLAESSCRI